MMTSPFFRTITAALPAIVLSVSAVRAADGWIDDFAKAKETATKESRDLLLDFTGSDWCPPCMALHEEVLSQDAFKKEALKHFVLVELDYPQEKEQSDTLKKQNEKLQKDYAIDHYPTVLLTDAQGRPYAETGYQEGGPAEYLKHLKELRELKSKRDAALKKAVDATGPEKAKFIMEALKEMSPAIVHSFYVKEIDEAIAADKDDASGAKKARDAFKEEKAFEAKTEAVGKELMQLQEDGKTKEFTARIDKFIADEKLTGLRKQQMMLTKLMVADESKEEEILKLLDEVIKVDPKTEAAEHAKMLKEQVSGEGEEGAAEEEKEAAEEEPKEEKKKDAKK